MPLPSKLVQLKHPLFTANQLSVYVKRDDLIHPIISGNKWRKLKGNIEQTLLQNKKGIISFGGAFSNHIHALAFACQSHGLKAIGIIRGEPEYQHNFTLSWASHWGMELQFVDRATYRLRHDASYLASLAKQYPDYLIVPEGGTNQYALTGMADVISELQEHQFDTLMLPVGSGGTIAGLIKADNNQHRILGVAVLKNADYLNDTITQLIGSSKHTHWQLLTQFHRGGYAKFSDEDSHRLIEFIEQTQLPVEPVYSGKMVLAFLDLIKEGFFPPGHRIVLLHTGGLQGLGGLAERKLITATQWPVPSAPQVQ